MPVSRTIAKLNRAVLNRVMRHVAKWAPGFGVIEHVGRKSGKRFQTPVNVYHRDGVFVVALTYGKDSDWIKNVQAAGGCGLVTRGRRYRLVEPKLVHDKERLDVPWLIARFLGVLRVSDFLYLSAK